MLLMYVLFAVGIIYGIVEFIQFLYTKKKGKEASRKNTEMFVSEINRANLTQQGSDSGLPVTSAGFCSNCGNPLSEGTQFCPQCGSSVNKN